MRELHMGDTVQWDYRYIVLSEPRHEGEYFKALHTYRLRPDGAWSAPSEGWFTDTDKWEVVEPTEEEIVAFAMFTLTGEAPLDQSN